MSRPSEPLLAWLRQQIRDGGHNTSSVAKRLGRPRAELRRVLQGEDALTVDDLLALSEVLELDPEALGVPAGAEAVLDAVEDAPPDPHWDNQPRALVALGFDLGIDIVFTVDVEDLGAWEGPDAVASKYAGKAMPLRLDAAYHLHMEPELDDEGLVVTVSFDRLYRVRIPWHAIRQVVFHPDPPVAVDAPDDDPSGPPTLRLVT